MMTLHCRIPSYRKQDRPFGGTAMPLARIDLIKGKPAEYRQTIGDVVYSAMYEVLKAPKDDRFQVITEHDEANFIYHPTFFGIDRSKDVIFVQLTLVGGRTLEQKTEFYKRVADDLHHRLGVRREDVFVSLVGTGRDDWSFGNGEVSLVDKAPH
jgi:4-oxalocrotonate tautomerase